jgi:hypothetical protein
MNKSFYALSSSGGKMEYDRRETVCGRILESGKWFMRNKWEIADKIMKKLLDRPISRPFLIPCEPGEDFPDDYFTTIRKPMDFRVIQEKLKSRKYRLLKEWINAVKLVFQNTLTYYSEGNPIRDLAEELDAVFENECEIFSNYTLKGWTEVVSRLREKLWKLNANPPFETGNLRLDQPLADQLCTDNEISNFVKAMEKIEKPKHHKALGEILREEEPTIPIGEETVEVDLLSLKASTIRRMQDFLKKKLGPEYPR